MIFALLENGKKDEAMNKCDNCKCNKVCDRDFFGFENCGNYVPMDCVEVVYCKDCIYARELDKNCEINREYYKHCALWRGDETKNVWHKYKKYYKDYSLVEAWGYCSNGERKGGETE